MAFKQACLGLAFVKRRDGLYHKPAGQKEDRQQAWRPGPMKKKNIKINDINACVWKACISIEAKRKEEKRVRF